MNSRRSFIAASAALTGSVLAHSEIGHAESLHPNCPQCTATATQRAKFDAAYGGEERQVAQAHGPVREIEFDSVPGFLKLPDDRHMGEGSGVAANSKGHVFVFTRANTSGPAYAAAAAELLEFGPDGRFIREIGKNLYAWSFAHTVKVDRYDNIWCTDKGSDMVVKFNPAGRVEMVFGRKGEASDEGTGPLKHPKPPLPPEDGRFRQVTDIAWDSKDNGYISDGYINSRIAKVHKDGDWLGSFGTPGTGPAQFNTPHTIAIDAQDRIYVGDRGNRRIQVFDTEGHFIKQFTPDVPYSPTIRAPLGNQPAGPALLGTQGPGAPWALAISPPPNQFLFSADAFPGRIYKMTLDGEVVGVLGRAGKQLKQFGWIHEMHAIDANTLLVSEILNWRVQKLILH